MGSLTVSCEMTLDAVIDHTDGWYSAASDHEKATLDELRKADAVLLGRKSYEGLSDVWPEMTDSSFAPLMNSLPKFVASRTLQPPLRWNATLLEGSVVKAVGELRSRHNLISYGCGLLAYELVTTGLVDLLHFWIHPVVFGEGERIFHGRRVLLHLTQTRTFESGVVLHSYRPA